MSIILYSTGCPKCNVLEVKLHASKIPYEVCKDEDIMKSKGMLSAPNLEVDGEIMDFGTAVRWINSNADKYKEEEIKAEESNTEESKEVTE